MPISLRQAVSDKISRLHHIEWAPFNYLEIDLLDDGFGPWFHFHSPQNASLHGKDPYDILFSSLNLEEKVYEPYQGLLAGSEEYEEQKELFDSFAKGI